MRYMKSFTMCNNYVDLILSTGAFQRIYFNKNSGKAFYRFKIQTISGVKHPGIYIGADATGIEYIAHNHYHYGKPVITTLDEFRMGQQIYYYEEYASNPPHIVIEKALNGILSGERYTILTFNCQSFVQEIISNKRTSPSVNNFLMGAIVIGLVAVAIKTY